MWKKTSHLFSLVLFCALILIILGLWIGEAKADKVTALQSRVSRLESENYRLRSRLDRLENQLKRGNVSNSYHQKPIDLSAPSIDKPMFDQLATLVIELKETIEALEVRVDALEQ
jgi:predicted RNase H-like nuclease (RuvC/YqgF family)